MKKVIVIGANSYIARNVVYLLRQQGDVELKLYDQTSQQFDGEEPYRQIDILDPESVGQIDMDCDAIFMFVGKTGSAEGFDHPDLFLDVNERALLHVLKMYRLQNSHAKIIFPSTRLVYKGKKGLQKEDSEKEFKTVYAMNKYACEQYLEQYRKVFGIRYCILRICIPYGTLVAGASSYGTAEFMLKNAERGENIVLYGDGSVRRTLTYMGDLCRILIGCAFSDQCINDVFNIGGEDYSLREMAECIASKYGVGIDYIPYPEVAALIESGDTVFDDQKLKGEMQVEYRQSFAKWVVQSR